MKKYKDPLIQSKLKQEEVQSWIRIAWEGSANHPKVRSDLKCCIEIACQKWEVDPRNGERLTNSQLNAVCWEWLNSIGYPL